MSNVEFHIGMDDIDDPGGRCTTHFASLVVELLSNHSVEWLDYPNLIRLNPGIPFRTRGNGAVALRFKSERDTITESFPLLEQMIRDYIDETYPNTNPGLVIVDTKVPEDIRKFSQQALWRTIPIQLARRLIERYNLKHRSLGNGRGLVGALSAIGNSLNNDYTFEYLAYRKMEQSSQKRGVDVQSVIEMDQKMGNHVFSNLDDKNRILIEPHGPDPVLYGIRGESASSVIKAASHIKSVQSVDRWMVFRTNQATGEHLKHYVLIRDLRPYMAAIVQGRVDSTPRIFEGGYVVFSIKDDTSRIDCVAYEPTRDFRDIIANLQIGDGISVHASVRPKSRTHDITLNLEGIEIHHLSLDTQSQNPLCPECNKRMKSAGSGKGFKCAKCGYRDREGVKIMKDVDRKITTGLYLPPLNAQRHLTRPLSRLNMNNSGQSFELVENWRYP
ncbi:DUF1743 domain-containing protein [Candidatus Thorarchaeota archaeon]|nr:MAG: DUF1743 domain-containing protein [Candidatus Thorarchaeota archaeon]